MRRPLGVVLLLVTALCVAVAWRWFPEAQPMIALEQRLTAETATRAARDFLEARGAGVADHRDAVRFRHDDDLQTYLELEAGGKPAVNSEVARGDVVLFWWEARFFRPGEVRETRVTLAPDGRVIGFDRRLADDDRAPALDSVAAVAIADSARAAFSPPGAAWTLAAASTRTVPGSERRDWTITFERSDRRLGEAPLRVDVAVRGDAVTGVRPYVEIPEAFSRRYAERRADNELYAGLASAFVPIIALLGVLALGRGARHGRARWKPALIGGAVIGAWLAAASVNEIGASWFDYATTDSPELHLLQQALGAVAGGLGMTLVAAVLLAAGEYLTREAFPSHLDWWAYGRIAAARPAARRILGGYTVAAFGLAYVSVFYVVTSRWFGWWSPSGLADDPNQIATPLPFVGAIAISLQAGVLEEVLFRAIPLALVARAVRGKAWAGAAMAAAVLGTALVFGFAHANYASWPAYARGVELFLEAVLWAVLYLRVGLVTTIVGHFVYDLTLFGLFAAAGDAPAYRVTLGVVVLAAAAPALLVAWRAWRTGTMPETVPADATFAAWQPPPREAAPAVPHRSSAPRPVVPRRLAFGLAIAGLVAAVVPIGMPPVRPFSVEAPSVAAEADRVVAALGVEPRAWRRLMTTETWADRSTHRFLADSVPEPEARRALAEGWLPTARWLVRYVNPADDVAARAESWTVRLDGGGRLLAWRHILPEDRAGAALEADAAEALGRAALARDGLDLDRLRLVASEQVPRPARRDWRLVWEDTTLGLPSGASARHIVVVAGDAVAERQRELTLPESWTREWEGRQNVRATAAVVAGFVLALLIIAGFVRLLRRPTLTDDPVPWPKGRRLVALLAAAAALAVLGAANEWPLQMAGWDTAVPLTRHQAMLLLGLAASALAPVLLWILWSGADGMRRRLAVPLRAASARDALLAGGALAAALPASSLPARLLAEPFPGSTTTVGATAVPWLAGVLGPVSDGLLSGGLLVLVGASIVGIAAAGPARRVVVALLVILGAVLLGGSGTWTLQEWAIKSALEGLGVAFAVAIVARLGGIAFESWVAAALVSGIAGGLSTALRAGTVPDRVAPLLGVAVAVAALAWLVTRPRGSRGGPATP